MAIKKTVTTVHGIEVLNAYHRVEEVKFQGKDVIQFHIKSYKDGSSTVPFADVDFGCAYDLAGGNPFQQAYAFVKSQEPFNRAEDC
jgi:hypothetical protein